MVGWKVDIQDAEDNERLVARRLFSGTKEEQETFDGGNWLFPRGYGQVADRLAEGLDIKLQHKVRKVEYTEKGVTATRQGCIRSDRAVVTLPWACSRTAASSSLPPCPRRNGPPSGARHGRGQQGGFAFRQGVLA